MVLLPRYRSQQEKIESFFKKEPKTPGLWRVLPGEHIRQRKKSFSSFLQKGRPFFLCQPGLPG
jgi:hypothetical protein